MTATTTARRPPSTVAVGPRAIVLNESPSVTPSGSYSAANSNGVTVNIIGIGVGFVGGALLLITLTLLTRLHLARRRAASQGLPRPQLWDVVFDSTRSGGALAIGRSLGGYDWDYRNGGDIWGARGLGLGGIWGFGLGGAGAGEKEWEVGRRPEMREVVLGVGVGKSDGKEQGDVRGFGFGQWKPTSLFLHEPSTDNSPPPTTNTVTNTAAITSPLSAPAPAPAPSSTSAPSPSAPSNPSPSNPNPSNPSPSSPSSNPQGLEIKADSRVSTTVLILLPSPKYPYTYTGNPAETERKTDGRLRGERGEKKEKKVYEVRHVEDVRVADVSDIKDAGDAWGRVMSWGQGDEGRGVDGIPGSGLAGTLTASNATQEKLREKGGRGNLVLPASTMSMSVGGSQQGLSSPSLVQTETLTPTPTTTTTQPQANPGEVEGEDDLPDFVLGVLELEVVADTPASEVNNPDSGDQAGGGEVIYPPKAALGQPVSGVSPRSDTGESPEATTSTATPRNVNGNGTARERTMPSDGLMRSFWRR